MSVLKKFAGQTMIYGLSTILSRMFNFILTPVYTSVYPASVYGVFTKFFSYASIINAILAFGMETTYFRYLNKYEDKKASVYNNSFIVIAFLATLFLITGLSFANRIAEFIGHTATENMADQKLYVQLFVWILFLDAMSVIPFAKLRADGRPIRYSLVKFVNIGIFVGLNLAFIYLAPALAKGDSALSLWIQSWYKYTWVGYVFVSNLIASVCTLIMLLPQFFEIRFQFNKKLFVDMFGYSWPILVANLSFIINENLDKILLSKYLPALSSDHDIGIYGAVCKLAIFISIFNTAFRLGAEPFFFSHAKQANARQTYAHILYYFVIALAILFVGLTANINIIKRFIGPEYWEGLHVVPVLLFGYVCLGIYMNLSVWYRLSDQTRYGVYISGVGAIFTIVMNIWLIPKFSYVGSAWVSMLTYLFITILSYVLGQKNYPIPYEIKKMLLYLAVSVVLVVISFWGFNRNFWLGNLLWLGFMAGVFYFEKNRLKIFLKR